MDLAEFDRLADVLRQKSAQAEADYGFALIEGRIANGDEIAQTEQQMGITLPDKYKVFMRDMAAVSSGSLTCSRSLPPQTNTTTTFGP